MSREGLFPLEALIRAMAPVQVVMDAFSLACRNSTGSPTGIGSPANQALLARLLHRIEATICTHHSISSHDPPEEEDNPQVVVVSCAPSRRYIHRLVHRYVALLEQQPNNSNLQNHYSLEDDDLMEWVYRGSMEGRHHLDDPNPTDSGYVTFRLPTRPTTSTTTSTTILHPPSRIRMDDNPNEATTSGHSHNPNAVLDDGMDTEEKEEWLAIRVFPHHNQVGLQKVWEAGACLAEFLHQYPDHVRNKKVVEWGAGVGLTGFIVDRIGAERVHLTDGTSALVLDNLTHNVSLYQDQRINSTSRQTNNPHTNDSPPALITTGYFEWGDYAEEQQIESSSSSSTGSSSGSGAMVERMKEFEVLLAADVVYDRNEIPHLVLAVRTFLEQGGEYAIFATTYRNQVTFDLFQTSLKQQGVAVQEIPENIIYNLPRWLPCYYSQLRSEVRIAIMTIE